MSSHAPKVDPIAKIVFIASSLAILAVIYVLISNLLSTYKRNSTKGEVDTTQLVLKAEENLKPIGASALSGAPVVGAAGRGGKEIYDAVCSACHATGVLGSPKFGDNAAWSARAKGGLDALLTSATNGKNSMPAKGGDPSLTDSEIRAVVLYMTKEAGLDLGGATAEKKEAPATAPKEEAVKTEEAKVEKKPAEASATAITPAAPVAATTPMAEATKKEEMKTEAKTEENTDEKPTTAITPPTPEKAPESPAAPVVAAVAPAAAAPAVTSTKGKEIYNSVCFTCHATGIAGSPKFGDKAAWAPRIATGMDNLYHTALNGKGAMPPKGGNLSLNDDDVKAAVDYMVNQAK